MTPRRTGDPLTYIQSRLVTDGDCLVWPGARFGNGYGEVKFNRRLWPVHRLVYTLAVGPIPVGMQVLHRCDRPLCAKPEHLFLGTQKDNVNDMMAKGRGRGQFGHER